MKSLALSVVLPALLLSSASVEASSFQLVQDPSGAPMCADAEGYLAPLASCAELMASATHYTVRTDPSGAAMCFAANGDLAPLGLCDLLDAETELAEYRLDSDPSGAPMCFAANGELAPLSSCAAKQLAGLWAGLDLFDSN